MSGLRRLKLKNKKAAFEMSITTIVILVIAMTMLILGMVLVRKMMCGAMGLTTDINDKVRGQIDDLFQSQGGEVQCIGSGTGAVDVIPGKTNYVWCGIKSTGGTPSPTYTIKTDQASLSAIQGKGITLIGNNGITLWSGQVAGSDNEPKKILRLDIPKDASEGLVIVQIIAFKSNGGTPVQFYTGQVDLNVRRLDWFRGTIC